MPIARHSVFHRIARRPGLCRPTFSRLVAAAVLIATAMAACVAVAGPAAKLDRAMAAVLVVYSNDRDQAFLGSAFVYGDGRMVVTNAHVLRDHASVSLRNAAGLTIAATVSARDPKRDIAILMLERPVFGPGLQPSQAAPGQGQPVFALGAPLGMEFTVTSGMISAVRRQVDPAVPLRLIQHDAAVNPGSSGGPLVDEQGRLVGMNSQIADGSRMFVGIAFAISAADIGRVTERMLNGTTRPVPDLGLRARPVSRRVAAALGLAEGQGLLVDQVTPQGVADRCGIRAGDVILKIADTPVTGIGDFAFEIDERRSDNLAVSLWRSGQSVTATLDLHPPAPILPRMQAALANAVTGEPGPAIIDSYTVASLGIGLDDLTVRSVMPASPAHFAGLAADDRILAANGRRTSGADLAALVIRGPLLLLVGRDDGTLHVIIDPWSRGRTLRPVGGANVLDPEVVLF